MTSEQVMLTLTAWLLCFVLGVAGCSGARAERTPVPRLASPYQARQVWAVAPLSNESGSLQADGVAVADHLARQLERADGIDVVPVSRVLAAMETLRLSGITNAQEAAQLRQTLEVDALVVGSLSVYDPYDPPKLGLALELYVDTRGDADGPFDIRSLSRAPTDRFSTLPQAAEPGRPASVVSGYYDAADPTTRLRLQQYAAGRGGGDARPDERWWMYRISMDLYTEFVSYQASSRLLAAERRRLQTASHEEPVS